MSTLVIEKKVQAEVHPFHADFTQQLKNGETITVNSWTVSVSTIAGTDTNPSALLLGTPTISGNVITQQLQQGIPGVIYLIVIQVTTSLSNVYTVETKLAVLPNDYPAQGVSVTLYVTSQPYPYYASDTVHISTSISASEVQSLKYLYSFGDTAHTTGAVTSAAVSSTIIDYNNYSDTLHTNSTSTSGAVTTIIVPYSFSDTMHSNAAVLASNVTTVLVDYSFSDMMHTSGSVTSATVT